MSETCRRSPAPPGLSLSSVRARIAELARTSSTREAESELFASMSHHKSAAVTAGDQDLAKDIWCLEAILNAQLLFARAFQHLRFCEYYKAWCDLQDAEDWLGALSRHHPMSDYGLEWLSQYVPQFQAIFPYRKFASIGYVIIEKRCGLCGAVLTPRSFCQHRLGEIYDGRMCFHAVTEWEANHVALVDDPLDKGCIIQLDYDFTLIQYLVDHLQSPYDAWRYQITTMRHPHSSFPSKDASDPCPCNSGMTYGECCASDPLGVLMQHVNFTFAVPPKKPMSFAFASGGPPRERTAGGALRPVLL